MPSALVAADYRRQPGPIVDRRGADGLGRARVRPDRRAAGARAAALLGVAATAPLAVIRRFPAAAAAIVLAANAVFITYGRLSWSVAAVIGWLITLAACPLLLGRRPAVVALALTEAAALLGAAGLGRNVSPWDASIAEALAALAAWGAGEMLLARRESAAERADNAERMRQLRERDAAASERASIARELHDVVAHHVSMIAVRAATAPYAVPGLTEPGQEAFAEIADEARTALTELRVALGVLRGPDGAGKEAAPQPRIADLAALRAEGHRSRHDGRPDGARPAAAAGRLGRAVLLPGGAGGADQRPAACAGCSGRGGGRLRGRRGERHGSRTGPARQPGASRGPGSG